MIFCCVFFFFYLCYDYDCVFYVFFVKVVGNLFENIKVISFIFSILKEIYIFVVGIEIYMFIFIL